MVLTTLCKSSKRVSTTYYICTTTAACSRRNCPIGKYWSVKRGIGENLVTQLIVSKRVFASISARHLRYVMYHFCLSLMILQVEKHIKGVVHKLCCLLTRRGGFFMSIFVNLPLNVWFINIRTIHKLSLCLYYDRFGKSSFPTANFSC